MINGITIQKIMLDCRIPEFPGFIVSQHILIDILNSQYFILYISNPYSRSNFYSSVQLAFTIFQAATE